MTLFFMTLVVRQNFIHQPFLTRYAQKQSDLHDTIYMTMVVRQNFIHQPSDLHDLFLSVNQLLLGVQ